MLRNLKKYSVITLSIIFIVAIGISGFALQAQAEGPGGPGGSGRSPAKSGGGKAVIRSENRAPAQSINRAPSSRPGSAYTGRRGPSSPQRQFIDSRYQHNRSYPPRGRSFRDLPRDHRVVIHGGARYYSHDGVWYRHHHGRYLVIAPPIGLFVPFLPFFYTTVYWHGIPYYYANDSYYTETPGGYVVVEPPQGEISEAPPETEEESGEVPEDKMFIYPRKGQSEEQQEADRYECHQWAAEQTKYDPTKIPSGIPSEQIMQRRADYQRLMAECLDSRGYTAK